MNEYPIMLNDRSNKAVSGSTGPQGARLAYVAVVHTRGAICHICAATTVERLAVRLGEYVRENARYQLCPGDADRVLALLGADRAQDAVDLYFAATGERWDREELVVQRTGLGVEA